jgi:hypothetical protein
LLHPLASRRDFNEEVARAIDATLREKLGELTSRVLCRYLKDEYDIGPDEMPSRLPIVTRIFEEMFGVFGTKVIGSDVAKKLYSQLGIRFVTHWNYSLEDYVEEALKLHPNHKLSNFTVMTQEPQPRSSLKPVETSLNS